MKVKVWMRMSVYEGEVWMRMRVYEGEGVDEDEDEGALR